MQVFSTKPTLGRVTELSAMSVERITCILVEEGDSKAACWSSRETFECKTNIVFKMFLHHKILKSAMHRIDLSKSQVRISKPTAQPAHKRTHS